MGKKPKRAEIVQAEIIDGGLDSRERALLAEALRRADEARDAMEDGLRAFGRWMLANLFADDTAAVLSEARGSAVYRALLARADGPTLRLSARMVSVALRVAAYDQRINDEAWRGLDLGRKEALLPLGDERSIQRAARRVSALKMTRADARRHVEALLAEQGRPSPLRLTAPRLNARVKRLRESIEPKGFLRKVQQLAKALDPEQRDALAREAEALRDAAEALLRSLRSS